MFVRQEHGVAQRATVRGPELGDDRAPQLRPGGRAHRGARVLPVEAHGVAETGSERPVVERVSPGLVRRNERAAGITALTDVCRQGRDEPHDAAAALELPVESAAPVQVASPMVRKRTVMLSTFSSGWTWTNSVTAMMTPWRTKQSRWWEK